MMPNASDAGRLTFLVLLTVQRIFASPSNENNIQKRSPPIGMGLASGFGAIAATTLTSTGNTVIKGDCGACPGSSVNGFPPGVCTGTTSAGGTAACNAEASCLSAYNDARALVSTAALPSSDLVGLTLAPGVYIFPTSEATLSGNVTLDGSTNPGGQWIFQISTTFTTAVDSKVILSNGALPCNVFFLVGSSATISGATTLQGNVLAYTSIAVGEAASNMGTLCALNGAATMIDDAVASQPFCTTFPLNLSLLFGILNWF